ncbi:MAG: DNA repair protein RecO [Planctomycetes bacterium HGW-Planctomycetes-1]|nr:MAG: DNA repair protein RecO [Planctomycetes bacterium HGW-Planctomycetes-1]
MTLKKDKGICIRTTDYSESSQILNFFTRDNGKIGVIAKGSRRPKSSFLGAIEICTIGDMVFSHRDNEKLGTLTEFNPTFLGLDIRKKLLALNCAYFAAEMLNLFTKELDPHPVLFDEAESFLQKLDQSPPDKIVPFLIQFEFAILEQTGSQPLCDGCANCKRKFDAGWKQYFFSFSAAGLVCRDCESVFVDKKMITPEGAACLNQPEKILNAKPSVLADVEKILIEYITNVLERPLKTAPMILKLIK